MAKKQTQLPEEFRDTEALPHRIQDCLRVIQNASTHDLQVIFSGLQLELQESHTQLTRRTLQGLFLTATDRFFNLSLAERFGLTDSRQKELINALDQEKAQVAERHYFDGEELWDRIATGEDDKVHKYDAAGTPTERFRATAALLEHTVTDCVESTCRYAFTEQHELTADAVAETFVRVLYFLTHHNFEFSLAAKNAATSDDDSGQKYEDIHVAFLDSITEQITINAFTKAFPAVFLEADADAADQFISLLDNVHQAVAPELEKNKGLYAAYSNIYSIALTAAYLATSKVPEPPKHTDKFYPKDHHVFLLSTHDQERSTLSMEHKADSQVFTTEAAVSAASDKKPQRLLSVFRNPYTLPSAAERKSEFATHPVAEASLCEHSIEGALGYMTSYHIQNGMRSTDGISNGVEATLALEESMRLLALDVLDKNDFYTAFNDAEVMPRLFLLNGETPEAVPADQFFVCTDEEASRLSVDPRRVQPMNKPTYSMLETANYPLPADDVSKLRIVIPDDDKRIDLSNRLPMLDFLPNPNSQYSSSL